MGIGTKGVKVMLKCYYPKALVVADFKQEVAMVKYSSYKILTTEKEDRTFLKHSFETAREPTADQKNAAEKQIVLEGKSDKAKGEHLVNRMRAYNAWEKSYMGFVNLVLTGDPDHNDCQFSGIMSRLVDQSEGKKSKEELLELVKSKEGRSKLNIARLVEGLARSADEAMLPSGEHLPRWI